MKYLICIFMIVVGAILNGCVTAVVYNPSYLNTELQNKPVSANCKAFVYTTEVDDNLVYIGSPSSMTGSVYVIEIPLGIITKEITQSVFNQVCLGGTHVIKDLKTVSASDLVVYSKVNRFNYRYNDAKNLGLAVTAQVRIVLDVSIIDSSGHAYYTGEYDSGYVDGDTYLFHLSPIENVNKLTHKVVYELMSQAASKIVTRQSTGKVGINNKSQDLLLTP